MSKRKRRRATVTGLDGLEVPDLDAICAGMPDLGDVLAALPSLNDVDFTSMQGNTGCTMLKVSEQVRRLVRGCGLSQRRLCQRIDLDPAIMSRFMTGKGGLSMEALDRLGEVLKLRVTGAAKPAKDR